MSCSWSLAQSLLINKIPRYMKHLFKLLTMAFICLIWLSSCNSGNVESKFISNDSLAIYTFSEDSLYIDDARSGCPLSAYKLVNASDNRLNATSIMHDPCHKEDSVSKETISIREIQRHPIYGTAKYEVSIGEEYKDTIAPLKDYVHTAI